MLKADKQKLVCDKKEREKPNKKEVKHIFSSKEEYIDYAFGSDPVLCQALKNCLEE